MIFTDSRKVKKGTTYIAIKGTKTDGHDFISQAIENGAEVLIVENKEKVPKSFHGKLIIVQDCRDEWSRLENLNFGSPSNNLFLIGVTGTNGKTSTAYMIEHLLNHANISTGVLGTVNHHYKNHVWDSNFTTPFPSELNHRLKCFLDLEAKACVMEVSSHALAQKRADYQSFDVGVFTNLSQDHLDYHYNTEDYFSAKFRLFNDLPKKSQKKDFYPIINLNDNYLLKKSELFFNLKNIITLGKDKKYTFSYKIINQNFFEQTINMYFNNQVFQFQTQLIGEYNIHNWLGALAACSVIESNMKMLSDQVFSFSGVPGRLQRVAVNRNIFVDFAHTPDALENVLKELKSLIKLNKNKSKLLLVFGCGGERDTEKRPMMGRVAETYADKVYITSDNPRNEDPKKIIDDIKQGMKLSNYVVEYDREMAIEKALNSMANSDILVIAGKGHENYQLIGDEKKDFNDFKVIQKYLGKY